MLLVRVCDIHGTTRKVPTRMAIYSSVRLPAISRDNIYSSQFENTEEQSSANLSITDALRHFSRHCIWHIRDIEISLSCEMRVLSTI